jgi:hypothetical protein
MVPKKFAGVGDDLMFLDFLASWDATSVLGLTQSNVRMEPSTTTHLLFSSPLPLISVLFLG